MQDFKALKVWEKAHSMTIGVYQATSRFPRSEEFGLRSQIRRASASIPANIAEGCGRGSQKEFAQFLHVALGSTNELEYHLILARDLGYLPTDSHQSLDIQVSEVRRMLARLVVRVRDSTRIARPG
ncbi:MAG: four helix bundle protein [Gammaproteobacteria bacterium RBG_16_66_13]|nr:MAG: four helix bundle protein [Gammaproteobacteria bacterium RBG_16_66_13]